MPKLTPEEKEQARQFRDVAQAALTKLNREGPQPGHTDKDPKPGSCTYAPPNFLAIYRHPCAKRLNAQGDPRSTAMQLHEVYVHSTEPIEPQLQSDAADEAVDVTAGWPGGTDRFGFIYREGVCKDCKETSRSPAGRLVDAYDRPPTKGKVARSSSGVAATERKEAKVADA